MNKNVFLTILLALGYGAVGSIWEQTITGAYMTQTYGDDSISMSLTSISDSTDVDDVSNERIFLLVSSDGLLGLLIAFPLGLYLDSHMDERAKVIRYAGWVLVIGFVTLSIVCMSVKLANKDSGRHENIAVDDEYDFTLWLYISVEFLWLILREVMEAPVFVLYLASLNPDAARVWGITLMYSAKQIFSFVGPVITVSLYELYRKDWEGETVQLLMVIMLLLMALVSILLFFFDDNDALYRDIVPSRLARQSGVVFDYNNEDDTRTRAYSTDHTTLHDALMQCPDLDEDDYHEKIIDELANFAFDEKSIAKEKRLDYDENNDVDLGDAESENNLNNTIHRPLWLPFVPSSYSIAGVILIGVGCFGFGVGLIADYARRFLIDHSDLSTSQVEIGFIIFPFLVVTGFFVAQSFSFTYGRSNIIFFSKGLGTFLTLLTSLLLCVGANKSDAFILIIVLAKFALGVTIPLEVSILVDVVNGKQLGLFLAIFGVFEFSWNGADFVAHEIEDATSSSFLFFISGLFCTVGLLYYWPLVAVGL